MFIKVFILGRLCQSHQRNLLEMTSGPLPHLLNESWQWGPEIRLPNPEAGKYRSHCLRKDITLLFFSSTSILGLHSTACRKHSLIRFQVNSVIPHHSLLLPPPLI